MIDLNINSLTSCGIGPRRLVSASNKAFLWRILKLNSLIGRKHPTGVGSR